MYLLDTNVVSELRKPRPHGGVLAWLLSGTAIVELLVQNNVAGRGLKLSG